MAPFLLAASLAFALAIIPSDEMHIRAFALAIGCNTLVFVAAFVATSPRTPAWLDVLPPLLFVIGTAALRHAAGGSGSGFEALAMLPVFWSALYDTRRHLAIVLGATGLAFTLPMIAFGDPMYPLGEVRTVALWMTITSIVGIAAHSLVTRMRALADRDEVTGLLNRRAVMVELMRERARYERDNERLTIAVFDLDGFKKKIDEVGNSGADRFLRECAESWGKTLRPTDSIGRLNEMEYLLLLPGCFLEHAAWVVTRLQEQTPEHWPFSAGIVTWDGSVTVDHLVAQARTLALRAKQQGAGTVIVADTLSGATDQAASASVEPSSLADPR